MANAERPVRVAFVLHVMQVAGAEMLVYEIIRRLGSRIAPLVICLDAIGELGRQSRREGIDVISLDRRPGLDVGLTRRMARLLATREIDVIHAHQYAPFLYSALAKTQTRRRPHLIFTEHGRHYPDIVSPKRRLANRLLLARLANSVTAVCEFSARSLVDVEGFQPPIDVVPNGVDLPPLWSPAEQHDARVAFGLAPERRFVICVARFHPVKDHPMLIRAFASIAPRHEDTDLLLVGDGPDRGRLETMVRDLGIGPRVHFLGVRSDVPRLLQASDIFAMTSVSEAASITLLEAMAAARPVVVTAVGGNPEIARHGSEGLLVPRGDADAAAQALGQLLADDALRRRMGDAGRQRIVERYRLQDTVEEYGRRFAVAAGRDQSSNVSR